MAKRRHRKAKTRRAVKRFRDRPVAAVVQWLVCSAALAVLVCTFYGYLQTSPVYAVQWIRVEGTDFLSPKNVLDESGLTRADNLLFLDSAETHARVESIPYVKTCRLERVFPNQVTLELEERVPVATLLVNNHLFEIDTDGVVLRELAADRPHVGPLITNVQALVSVEPSQELAEQHPALMTALDVWKAFSGVSMAGDVTVSELAAFGTNEIIMYCNELPFEIRWGRGDFAEQARLLDILWREKHGELGCREYLDLRFGADLVCK